MNAEKLPFQMTAAVLSIKTKRLSELAVGSALSEGQKIKIFKEKKKKRKAWNSRMSYTKRIPAKNLSCLIGETPAL